MKKLLFTSVLFSALIVSVKAQDPIFTQQNYGLALINPAYTGAFGCGRAELGYRLQWPALYTSYQTFNAAYDQQFGFGGTGFCYSHDEAAGLIKTDRFDFSYAYGFGFGDGNDGKPKFTLRPGIQFSYFRKTLDWNALTWGDQIDPRRGYVYNTTETPAVGARNCFDISAGVIGYSKRLMFGLATYHINEPNQGFIGTSKLPMRYVMHASGIIGNADAGESGLSVIPSVAFMKQQDFEMLTLLATVKYNAFSLGAGYRNLDAVLFTAGYTRWNFTLGYSYDYTVSALSNTGGSHELHLAYCFMKDQWSDSRRNVQMFF